MSCWKWCRGVGAALVLLSVGLTAAQDSKDEEFEKDPRHRAPKTVREYWIRLHSMLDQGEFDLAAKALRGLVERKPTPAELLATIEKHKYRMRGLDKLSDAAEGEWKANPGQYKQALQDVNTVLELVGRARQGRGAREAITRLSGPPKDRARGMRDLATIGVSAVPTLLDSLLDPQADRLVLLRALERMGAQAIPPVLAALDADDVQLKMDLLDFLRRQDRYAAQIVPHLWLSSARKDENPLVSKKAKALLAKFLKVRESRLPSAKQALTREAEMYYQHRIAFRDPKAVVIWRWDGRRVVQGWPGAPTVPAAQAEEYWGLRFARGALALDPNDRPAQEVSLSLAVDSAVQRHGLAVPLSKSAPDLNNLLLSSHADLLIEVLERALAERRTGVVLAVVRALGDRAEKRAKRPTGRGNPALVRALDYPDPNVQRAAAEALTRIPGPATPKTAARMQAILGPGR